jgi:hypothetical protein
VKGVVIASVRLHRVLARGPDAVLRELGCIVVTATGSCLRRRTDKRILSPVKLSRRDTAFA